MSERTITIADRARGCLLGLAIGDAVGTTVEFKPRGSFETLTDMVGGGPFALRAGEWTDDTSMALCLGASLLHCEGFDAADQMRRYCNWREFGYMSSNGRCFDIGNTVSAALGKFLISGDAMAGSTNPDSAGNGSIMRLAPAVLFYFPDAAVVREYCRLSSGTTHGAPECLDSCEILGEVLRRALLGSSKESILEPVQITTCTPAIQRVAEGDWKTKSINEISGSGYVVDCLEAALWCFHHSESYADCVLMAANLGDDADTTAAVAGQIAGAHYGVEGLPESWRSKIVMHDEILSMADGLINATPTNEV